MSFFEDENNQQPQHPEQHTNNTESAATPIEPEKVQPPVNEYWVRDPVQQRPNTTPHGYGQGYPQPPSGGYPPQYPPNVYQNGGYQPQYRQPQPQYQYNPNSGWQQPPTRPPENYQWNFEDYDKASEPKAVKRRNRGAVVFVVSLICVIAVGLVGVTSYGIYQYISGGNSFAYGAKETASSSEPVSQENTANPLELASKPQISETLPVGGKMTIPQVAKSVGPSVVGVIQYRPDMYLEETGFGSGIIMSADGYVITNAHVVVNGTAFKVLLADGTPKDAELVGYDTLTDLAVLKVQGVTDLIPAVFGDSTQIEVGETALVIGNPGPSTTTLAGSVTQGIISAVNREIASYINVPLIQTDAAINPGNSGGALVNEYGQVIGIASAKIVAENYEGICFAIPISDAKPIIDDIVAHGRVTGRVKLGISGREIDEIDARNYGLQMGVRIEEIDPASDLNNTSIQKFDIITHIDGERITGLYELKKCLEKYKPGDKVRLTLFRAIGSARSDEFEVTIALMEDK